MRFDIQNDLVVKFHKIFYLKTCGFEYIMICLKYSNMLCLFLRSFIKKGFLVIDQMYKKPFKIIKNKFKQNNIDQLKHFYKEITFYEFEWQACMAPQSMDIN